MSAAALPRRTRVSWTPSWRIVPSRFPPVGLFDRIASPGDLEALFELEGLTNPRLRQELGELSLVPPGRRISGPGTTPIMAAFTHPSPQGSRFSDGSYGVFYAGKDGYVSLTGTAAVVDDPARLKELWGFFTDSFMEGGPEDPNSVLLEVTADTAQWWDTPGAVVTVVELVRAKVTGDETDLGDSGITNL